MDDRDEIDSPLLEKKPERSGEYLLFTCPVRSIEMAEPVSATQSGVLRQGETKTLTLPGGATMELIYVASGAFTMGSPSSEVGRFDDESLVNPFVDIRDG